MLYKEHTCLFFPSSAIFPAQPRPSSLGTGRRTTNQPVFSFSSDRPAISTPRPTFPPNRAPHPPVVRSHRDPVTPPGSKGMRNRQRKMTLGSKELTHQAHHSQGQRVQSATRKAEGNLASLRTELSMAFLCWDNTNALPNQADGFRWRER